MIFAYFPLHQISETSNMFQPWKSAIDLTTTLAIKKILQFYGKWFFLTTLDSVFFVNPGRWFGYLVVVFSRPGSASPRRASLFFFDLLSC